jgi:hypothetical protein
MQLDMTELKLFQAIDQGEAWVILYYLKTQGRERGDIEKVDTDVVTPEQLVLMAHTTEKEEEQAKA